MKISYDQCRCLRGGGVVCQKQQQQKKVSPEHVTSMEDDDLIQHLIHDIEFKSQEILEASKRIGLNESKEKIMMNIGWFHRSSQFINQIRQNKKMVQENINIVLASLKILLEAVINVIQSQRFYAWLILKICNYFSLLIFIYYINNPKQPMKTQDQKDLLQYLEEVQQYMKESGGTNSYENSIQYEFELLQMCIQTCPNDSQEGQDIIINTFRGIISSIAKMSPSPDLLSALGKGVLYLFKENSKRRQKETFQVIFYLEQLKWQIIESIQNGKGLYQILIKLGDNYKRLVQNTNSWIIKCSWIKMISEFLSYRPLITQQRFKQLMNQYQFDKSWDQIIQQKFIIPIDPNKLIGIIQLLDSNDQAVKILQKQYTVFEQLKTICINGNQNIPQFETLIQLNNEKEQQNKDDQNTIDQIIKLQQFIENIKINEIQEGSKQLLIKYQDYIDGFINLKDQINTNQQQFLSQIDQLSSYSSLVNQQLYDFYLQNNIVNQQLLRITELEKKEINKNDEMLIDKHILIGLLQHYFNIILEFRYNLVSPKEEFDQFCKYFQENKLMLSLLSQDNKLFVQQIIDQIEDNDFNKLIIKFEYTLKDLMEKCKNNPFVLIRKYTDALDGLISIIFTNLREEINIEQQYLYYFATLISHDKNLIEEKINQIQMRKQQYFYLILAGIGNLYEQLSNIVFGLKFNSPQAQLFKKFEFQQVLQVYCNLIKLEVKQLSSYKIIIDPIQKKENINFFIELLTFNKILHKFRNLILDSSSQIVKIKSKINKLKSIANQSNKQPQIIDYLIQNNEQLIKYLNMEDNQDKYNFTNILTERMLLLSQLKESQFDIDSNLIDNAIKINKILVLDGFQQFQEVQQQIIQKQKEILDDIIDQLSKKQNKLLITDKTVESLDRIMINLDKLVQELNAQNIVQQKMDQNNSNHFILKISQCQNDNEQNQNLQTEIEQEYNKIMEQFNLLLVFNQTNVQEIIQSNDDIIQQLLCSPIPDDYIQNVIFSNQQNKKYEQKLEQAGFLQIIKDSLNDEQWRIKECFYFNGLIIYQSVSNQNIKNKIGQILLYGKFKETDFRVIQTLKKQEYKQQMEELINHQWQEAKEDVKIQLQDSLIYYKISNCNYKERNERLKEKSCNNNIGILKIKLNNNQKMSLKLVMYQESLQTSQKIYKRIQQQYKKNSIIFQIKLRVWARIFKFLRGKSPQQLLEIRMEQVISNKINQDSQSVYVQIFTKEFDMKNKKEIEEKTPLFNHENYTTGEVDKFLKESQKSSFLIHGIAGSGKSLSARKVEEYLWLLYKKTTSNKLWEQISETITIPIFIQLPTLKEPKFNAIEETLESAIYLFDQKQINIFKEIVQSNIKIKLLFIMDSYDELAQQYQQINLIQTNKVSQWKHPNEINNPKVITTSRSEIFTTTYQSWFYGDNSKNDESLKEVRLLSFDEKQRELFLKQFSQLQLKLKIKEQLEIISKNQQQDYILQETLIIFDKIQYLINQEDQFILSNQSSQQIIDTLLKHPNLLQINKEQQKSFSKQIQVLWSAQQYETIIKQLNLKEMLETPFFMNIVVAVLPQMNEKLHSQGYLKIRFPEYYKKNKILQIENIIANYECKKLNYQDYELNEIEELKQIKNYNDIIINESLKVWEGLIDSKFFKHFNSQKSCMDVIKLISESLNQKQEIFSMIKKEQENNQNYLVIYKSLVTKTQTIYDFYQEFLNNYIEKQRQKLSYSSEIIDQNRFLLDIDEYSMKLAVVMTKQNETVIEIKQQGILFRQDQNKDPYSEFFQDQDKYGNYRILIRKCLPIKQKANFFQFQHKSIQEYLFAKQIVDCLQKISQEKELEKQIIELRNRNKTFEDVDNIEINDKDFKDFLKSLNDNYLNQDLYLGSSQMQGQLKFIKAALQYQQILQNTCYSLSRLSSVCNKFVKISSNALFLYSNLLQYIENKDFSRIIIENISLDGINFINCNFNESQLTKVSINGINLNYSHLTNAKWIDCYTNDLPSFQDKSKIQCICLLKNETQIISGHEDGTIKVWDKQKAIILNQYLTDQSQIIDIKPMNDDYFMALHQQVKKKRKKFNQLKLWKNQNNTFEFVKDIQIDIFNYSRNQNYFAYYDDEYSQVNVCDKNLNIHSNTQFEKNLLYLQIMEDRNQIYVILEDDNDIDENICVWNFIDDTKQYIKINQINQFYMEDFSDLYCKFSQNFQFLAIPRGDNFYLFNITAKTHTKFNLENVDICEFSYNNKYLGLGGDFLCILDIQTQSITQKLSGFNSTISSIIFNTKLTEIITLCVDGFVKFWDLQQCLQNTQQFSKDFNKKVQGLQTSMNGKLLFVQIDNQLYVYDSSTGQQIDSIDYLVIEWFNISPIRQDLYFNQNNKLQSYEYNFKTTTQIDITSKFKFKISSDGKFFCTINKDNGQSDFRYVFQLYQIDRNNKVLSTSDKLFSNNDFPHFSNNCQKFYYMKGDKLVSILFQEDLSTGNHSFQQDKEILLNDRIESILSISLDNQKLFVKYININDHYQLSVIDIDTQQILANYGRSIVDNIDFSLDNKYIFLSIEAKINILDYKTYKQIDNSLNGHYPCTIQLIVSPNGQQFISLGLDNKVKIWENNINFKDNPEHQKPFYLKLTIPQKSNQNIQLFNTKLVQAKITSHLGYDIKELIF